MTEYEEVVQKQTDEVHSWRGELRTKAEDHIENLEKYISLLEQCGRAYGHRVRHLEDTGPLADAYRKVSHDLEREEARLKERCTYSKQQYETSRGHTRVAEHALEQLEYDKPGVDHSPAHFTIDENGNAVQTRGDSPGWATQFLQKDEEEDEDERDES